MVTASVSYNYDFLASQREGYPKVVSSILTPGTYSFLLRVGVLLMFLSKNACAAIQRTTCR